MAARCEFQGAKAVPHRPILNPGQLALSAPSLFEWLPDETLYSLCSRQHRFWCYVHAWQSARVLFGGRRLGTQHDFPSALDALVTRTQGLWGRAEDIATERTLLRFFRPFLAAEDVAAAIRTMRSPSVAHLKFSLGLLTSRFGASHPLKACPACIREDLDRYGWSYWHGAHQCPGVWICAEHREALLQSSVKTTGIGRFEWHLPSPDTLVPWCDEALPAEMAELGVFAVLVNAVVDAPRPSGWIADSPIGSAVGRAQAARDWITVGGSLRAKAAAENYLDYCAGLRCAPDLHELPTTREEAARQVGRLLRSIHDGTHPLRILVAMGWLFRDLANFEAALATEREPVNMPAAAPDPARKAHATDDGRRVRLVQLLAEGHSARSAARMVGVDVSTAIHWAVQADIAIQRRPKVLVCWRWLKTDHQRGFQPAPTFHQHETENLGDETSAPQPTTRPEVRPRHACPSPIWRYRLRHLRWPGRPLSMWASSWRATHSGAQR